MMKQYLSPTDACYLVGTTVTSLCDRLTETNPASWTTATSGVGLSPSSIGVDWHTVDNGYGKVTAMYGKAAAMGSFRTFLGDAIGPLNSFNVNINYYNTGLSSGGVPTDGPKGRWVGAFNPSEVTSVPLPSPVMDWPLISGPSVVSFAELYSKVGFCFVECVDVAAAITTMLPDILDGNAKTRATAQRDSLVSRGGDILGWVQPGDIDPWVLYPPTRRFGAQIRQQTGKIGDMDIGEINARLLSFRGQRVNIAVPVKDPYDVPAGFVDLHPNPFFIQLTSPTTATVSGTSYDVSDLYSLVPLLLENGVLCQVAALDAQAEGDVQVVRDNLIDMIAGSRDGTEYYTAGTRRDYGISGLGLINAAMKPLSKSQSDMINTLLTPGVLDALVSGVPA